MHEEAFFIANILNKIFSLLYSLLRIVSIMGTKLFIAVSEQLKGRSADPGIGVEGMVSCHFLQD